MTAVGTRIGLTNALRRAYPVNDVVEAIAARRAFSVALRQHRPRAVVFSTTTAALLAGRVGVPFAVWLDSPARLNRPGLASLPLHALERRQLARARVLMPHSPGAVAALPRGSAPTVLIPPPIPAALPSVSGRRRSRAARGRLHAGPEGQGARAAVRGLGAGSGAGRAARDRGDRARAGGRVPGAPWRRPAGGRRACGHAAPGLVSGPAGARPRVRQRRRVGGLRDRAARGTRSRRRPGGRSRGRPVPRPRDRALAGALVRRRGSRSRVAGARARVGVRRRRTRRWPPIGSAARRALEPYRPEASVRRLQEEVLPALLGA